MASPEHGGDHTLTAVTYDGAFRVIVARTTATVRAAIEAQGADAARAAEAFGDVLTGTTLVRLTMAPTYRVQGIVKGTGQRGTFIGDSHPDGSTRGLVQRPKDVASLELGDGAIMQMMRSLPRGDLHQGIVEVPATGVSGALMSYFQSSEQITAVAAVGTVVEGEGEVRAAGGYLVQLLPEVSRDPLAAMTARLADDFFSDRRAVVRSLHGDPRAILQRILQDMPYEETQSAALRFGCQCSHVRVLASLGTLPRQEIEELMQAPEHLQINCDYCGREYQVDPKSLGGLLERS